MATARPSDGAATDEALHCADSERETRASGFQRRSATREDPRAASEEPTSKTKWTVVQAFVRGDFHYQLRRRPAHHTQPRLTQREEQVLALARDGHSNKSIAYALGLSPSTVGVLLFRAAAKMGARSRRELLLAYARSKQSIGR